MVNYETNDITSIKASAKRSPCHHKAQCLQNKIILGTFKLNIRNDGYKLLDVGSHWSFATQQKMLKAKDH